MKGIHAHERGREGSGERESVLSVYISYDTLTLSALKWKHENIKWKKKSEILLEMQRIVSESKDFPTWAVLVSDRAP